MTSLSREEQQIQLRRITVGKSKNNVCVITLTGNPHKANVFTIALLQRLDRLLDQVEDNYMPCSLVLTGAGNKFFSAGFDLQALTGTSHNNNSGGSSSSSSSNNNSPTGKTPQGQDLVNYAWEVLGRLLVFPAPTITLFNGHAFGLGLFLGLACDHRVMMLPPNNGNNNKKKNALLCLPEITIGLPLGSGFAALAKCKMTPSALRTSALTGKQWTCQEALEQGIIDAVVPMQQTTEEILPQQVLKMAEKLVPTAEKGNLSTIKMELYKETHAVLVPQKKMQQQQRSKL